MAVSEVGLYRYRMVLRSRKYELVKPRARCCEVELNVEEEIEAEVGSNFQSSQRRFQSGKA
jgi:hypothetical protein